MRGMILLLFPSDQLTLLYPPTAQPQNIDQHIMSPITHHQRGSDSMKHITTLLHCSELSIPEPCLATRPITSKHLTEGREQYNALMTAAHWFILIWECLLTARALPVRLNKGRNCLLASRPIKEPCRAYGAWLGCSPNNFSGIRNESPVFSTKRLNSSLLSHQKKVKISYYYVLTTSISSWK